MDEILAFEQVDAIIVPLMTLGHTHVGSNHEITFAVVGSGDVSVACAALNACVLLGIEDSIAAEDVGVVITVAAHGISSVLSAIAHVTIEIAVVTFLQVLCRKGQGQESQAEC